MTVRTIDAQEAGGIKPWREDEPRQSEQPVAWGQGEAPRVLIVEDDAAIRDPLSTALTQQGLSVRAVRSGREGVLAMAEAPADILVVEYQLPDMEGLHVLEQVARYDSRVIGIVITGQGSVEMAVKAMKAGASELLQKPFKPDDVLGAIRQLMNAQHPRQAQRVLKSAEGQRLRLSPFQMADLERGEPIRAQMGTSTANDPSTDYLRGLAEGERQAKEQLAQIQRQDAILASAARQLYQAYAQLPDRMEAETVTLAFEIARKVIHACVEEKRDLIVTQVKEALARIRESKSVKILVHPSEVPLLEGALESLSAECDGPVSIKIEGDPLISRGGCRVESPTRLVDATIEGQLGRLAQGLGAQGNT